jgi:hypothetical protein
MLKQKIKTHRFGNKYDKSHFFILSKGNNAGKPLQEYCANCFVFIAETEDERWHYFWLFYGLWEGGYFRRFLTGSVIPFIRLDDLLAITQEAADKVSKNIEDYTSYVDYINQLNTHSENLKKQIDLIKQTKKALMYKILR